jgi:hypothetical protein
MTNYIMTYFLQIFSHWVPFPEPGPPITKIITGFAICIVVLLVVNKFKIEL